MKIQHVLPFLIQWGDWWNDLQQVCEGITASKVLFELAWCAGRCVSLVHIMRHLSEDTTIERTTKVSLAYWRSFSTGSSILCGLTQLYTDRRNRYILTLVDFPTRYPKAVPFQGIKWEFQKLPLTYFVEFGLKWWRQRNTIYVRNDDRNKSTSIFSS